MLTMVNKILREQNYLQYMYTQGKHSAAVWRKTLSNHQLTNQGYNLYDYLSIYIIICIVIRYC